MRHVRRRPHLAAIVAAVLAFGLAPAAVVHADATIVVDTRSPGLGISGCSLGEAILAANQDASTVDFNPGPPYPRTTVETGCTAGSGADTIQLPQGTYEFANVFADVHNEIGPSALPIVTSAITIEGRGATFQRASDAPAFRLLSVGPDGDLDLREVRVHGFAAQGGHGAEGGGGGLGAGGAIAVHGGALRVQWSTFDGNTATGGNGGRNVTFGFGGGGGGGMGGRASYGALGGGGGGGARGDGGTSEAHYGGGGGGTLTDGGFSAPTNPTVGGYLCGGGGSDSLNGLPDGFPAYCDGGGGGGGADGILFTGDGGDGGFAGGGGGGAKGSGNGGHGGFGGGGGAAGTDDDGDGGGGGDGGFGGGGGAGPGGLVSGEPGTHGTFAGDGSDVAGGGGGGLGGAIFGYQARILVSNSTFTQNAAVRGMATGDDAKNGQDAGGAIFAVAGSLIVASSTISGNETTGDGAGITVYQPLSDELTTFDLSNTIVAGNNGHDECFVLRGVTISGTNNLVTPHDNDDRDACPGITVTDDPQLGELASNTPGRTPTMALAPTSPAIDAGDSGSAPTDDQRGVPRPQGSAPDIGAYELDGGAPPRDTTPPVASPAVSPAANGDGWNQGDVTISWHWADEAGGSGIDGAACPATTTETGEGADLEVDGSCADLDGNLGHASRTVSIDRTAPTVTCGPMPRYTLGGEAEADVTATVSDTLSGPAETSVSADVTSSDIAAPGGGTTSLTGHDVAGNERTVDCPYVVDYAFGGFLQPIPQSSYKRGSSIPVRFRLGSADGTPIADADAAAIATACFVEVTFDATVRGCATYIPTTHTFQLDLKSAKSDAAGAHRIGIRVRSTDGVVLNTDSVTVALKK